MKLKASTEARAYLRKVTSDIRKNGWLNAPTSPKVGKHRSVRVERAAGNKVWLEAFALPGPVNLGGELDAMGRLVYPPKHGTPSAPTKKELEQVMVPTAEHMGLASGTDHTELVAALAAGIEGVWDGSEKARAKAVAAPELVSAVEAAVERHEVVVIATDERYRAIHFDHW